MVMGLTSASAFASGRILSLSSPVTKTQFQKSYPYHKKQQNRLQRQKQQKFRKRKQSMKLRRQPFPAISAKAKTRQIAVLEIRKMHLFYSLVAKKNTNVDKVITTISIGGMVFPFPEIPQSQHFKCHSVAFGPNFVAIITKIAEGAMKVMKPVADI
jgi:hypothetical protein